MATRRCIASWLALFLLLVSVRQGRAEAPRLEVTPDGTFSIVVIPDTQEYRGGNSKAAKTTEEKSKPLGNKAFETHLQWILDHLQTQRIVFVSHVGDIVDINVPEQWEIARHAMDRLHGVVPYGIAVGNHDLKPSGDSSLFQRYFPASRFSEFSWYGGTFPGTTAEVSGNNANSYQRFSAGGMDFVILHLECNAPDDVLQWADQVLEANAERRAIVTTHMGLGPLEEPKTLDDFRHAPKGRMTWKKIHGPRGNSPQEMWDKCFRKHANLFLVCSGDQSRTQAMRQTSKNDAGRTVHELLSDYHGHRLRVLRFVPQAHQIQVFTIDSRNGQLCSGTEFQPDVAQHQFTLDYSMAPVAIESPVKAMSQ